MARVHWLGFTVYSGLGLHNRALTGGVHMLGARCIVDWVHVGFDLVTGASDTQAVDMLLTWVTCKHEG